MMATTAEQRQTCPRRMSDWGPWERTEGTDTWATGHGLIGQGQVGSSCSFCGSLHPDRFMELVRDGWIVGPTDKNYKAYLSEPVTAAQLAEKKAMSSLDIQRREAKFYYQHLSVEQRREFVDLYNDHQMRIGYPGHFYRLPFFMQPLQT